MRRRYSGPHGLVSFGGADGSHSIQTGNWLVEDINRNPADVPSWRGSTTIRLDDTEFGRFFNSCVLGEELCHFSLRGHRPSENVSGSGIVFDSPVESGRCSRCPRVPGQRHAIGGFSLRK